MMIPLMRFQYALPVEMIEVCTPRVSNLILYNRFVVVCTVVAAAVFSVCFVFAFVRSFVRLRRQIGRQSDLIFFIVLSS